MGPDKIECLPATLVNAKSDCHQRHFSSVLWWMFVLLLSALGVSSAQAQHVSAEKLLPKNTLAYVHVASVPELVEAFQQTNLGRMIADPQIQPFVTKLYEAANNALTQVKESTGLSLDEIAHIPQGEITLAMLPTGKPISEGPSKPFGFAALVDCGNSIESARKFTDTIHTALEHNGYVGRQESVDGFVISIYEHGGDSPSLVSVERDNTLVFCTNLDVAKQLLSRWTTNNEDCLAENPRFAEVMNHCRGTKDEEPHLTFFADPIAIFSEIAKTDAAAQLALSILPTIGLDGIKGVGGSFVLATEDFDGISQFYLALGYPRSGVLELLALDSGDDTPPTWVPGDTASFSSLHWNLQQTFDKGTKLADTFNGPGATAKKINDRVQRRTGIDFEHELLPALTGRFLHSTWFEQPAKPGIGAHNLFALQLRDPKAFNDIYQKLITNLGPRLDKKAFAGIDYYETNGPTYFDLLFLAFDGPRRREDETRPVPCMAILDDWLLISDRAGILEHIFSHRDEVENDLASSLDFKLIASKVSRQPGGDKPGMLSFNQSGSGLKYLYDLAASDDARQTLQKRAGNSLFFSVLNQGLDQNPLPPWDVISRYLAPEGAMVTDDESGIHYMSFALRRK